MTSPLDRPPARATTGRRVRAQHAGAGPDPRLPGVPGAGPLRGVRGRRRRGRRRGARVPALRDGAPAGVPALRRVGVRQPAAGRDPAARGAGGGRRPTGRRGHRRRRGAARRRPGCTSAPRRCSTGCRTPTSSRSSTSTPSCWRRATGPAEQAMALLVRGARLVGPRGRRRAPARADVPAPPRGGPGGAARRSRAAGRAGARPAAAARPAAVRRAGGPVSGPGSDEVAAALRSVPGIGVGGAPSAATPSAPPTGTSSVGRSSRPPARRALACASRSTRPAPDPSVCCNRVSTAGLPAAHARSSHAIGVPVEGGPRGGGSPWPTPGARSASPARSASAAASRRRGACGRRARPRPPARGGRATPATARAAPALPMRIGGFDQMTSKRTSAGTSSGAATRMFARPLAAALAADSARARSLTSTAHTVGAGARPAMASGDRPGAAAEVEQRRPWAVAGRRRAAGAPCRRRGDRG